MAYASVPPTRDPTARSPPPRRFEPDCHAGDAVRKMRRVRDRFRGRVSLQKRTAILHPFLPGGGEAAEIIADFDWAATPLGPIETWPASLRSTIALILRSPVPIVTLWGEDGIMIYNDAY